MKISVICPTRKRTKDVARLVKSILDTCSDSKQIEAIFVIDDDDTESIKFINNLAEKVDLTIKTVVVGRNKFIFSDLANQAIPVSEGELFLAIGDDGVFRSENWDLEIIQEFETVDDRILLLHFNDLSGHAHQLAGHLAVHKNWIDTVGYFSPPWFNGDWGDWWLTHIGDGAGRRKYRQDIIIENLNIQFNKAEPDETYHQHKLRREAFGSPRSNPDHPFNTKKDVMKQNIDDLVDFIREH